MENQQPAHQDRPPTQYPTGRGYGHDYMRGGEVFGGYGYSERDEYRRPQGGEGDDATAEEEEPPPHRRAAASSSADGHDPGGQGMASLDDQQPPVPQLEHTFGLHRVGGHSRSFYVTQAQLQQRIYRPHRDSNGETENPSPS
jgi:hypothetical protein